MIIPRSIKILFLDDAENNYRALLKRNISQEFSGYEVQFKDVCNYNEAKEEIDQLGGNYQLTIIDLNIPERDGRDERRIEYGLRLSCYARKKLPEKVKIICWSANAEAANVPEGCFGLTTKPSSVGMRSLYEGGAENSIVLGRFDCLKFDNISMVHNFRHDILSPFLPLSTSLQGLFHLRNKKAFLLLEPKPETEEEDDFYKEILSSSTLSKIRNNIAEMFKLCAYEGPNKDKKASEVLGDVQEELSNFIENDDLKGLQEILISVKFEKHPIDEKRTPPEKYNDLVQALENWNKEGDGNRARKIINGIKDFADNLQKVVDFVEFGEVT